MKEQLSFTYDIRVIVFFGVSIEVENYLQNLDFVTLQDKDYLVTDLATRYVHDITDEPEHFTDIAMRGLESLYPNGCSISEEIFKELAVYYLLSIKDSCKQVICEDWFAYDKNSYVESKSLNIRIYCHSGQHYGACLALASRFFGKGDWSTKEVAEWIMNDIVVVSNFTSIRKILEDLRWLGIDHMATYEREFFNK